MAIKYTGGYAATSTANQDVIPLIKVSEGRETDTVFVLQKFSIKPASDCNIIINGGTQIFVASATGYTNDIRVTSLKIVENAIVYKMNFNY